MFLTLFLTFVKIGLLGFGGGLAIVQLIYDSIQPYMVMTQETFANIVAISQITPGPLGINVATFVGHECLGIPGAVVATLGVAFPAFVIMSIVCRMLKKFQSNRLVKGALDGIRPAVIGLIAAAVTTLAPPALVPQAHLGARIFSGRAWDIIASCPIDIIAAVMVAVTAVLIAKYKKSPILVLLIMGCIGAVIGV